MTDRVAHIIKTTHHDTGAEETWCGQTMDRPQDVPPGMALCAVCFAKFMPHELAALSRAVVEDLRNERRRCIGVYDGVTLDAENLERRVARLERKRGKRHG